MNEDDEVIVGVIEVEEEEEEGGVGSMSVIARAQCNHPGIDGMDDPRSDTKEMPS